MNQIATELNPDIKAEDEYLNAIWFTTKGASAAYTLFWTLANIDEEKALSWFRFTLDMTCKDDDLIKSAADFQFVASVLLEQLVIRNYHVDLPMTTKLLKIITEIEEKEQENWH